MKKVIKLIILIILSCSVYFIYQQTKNSTISVTSIGDNYSLGINSYGIKEYSYTDYYISYLKKDKSKVSYNKDYQARDLTIKTLLEKVANDPHFKNTISESNIMILTIGYNDLLYNLSITEKLNNNALKQIMNNINKNYNELIENIRKYNKNQIIVIGYYTSNKDNYYLNLGIRNLNSILSSNQEVTYIDTYNLLSERSKYFSNPNSNYPNRLGYQAISKKIIQKALEKK